MGDANLVLYAGHELHHVIDQLLQGTPKAVADLLGRGVDRAMDRVFGRRLDDKVDGLGRHFTRLETTLGVINVRLQQIGTSVDAHERMLREAGEPATHAFVSDCLEAAFESPDEAKQCVLGDLIAARLTAATESFEELQLRQAQRIVRDSSAAQLLALARVLIVSSLPFTFEEHVPLAEVLRFFKAVDDGTSNAGVDYNDMRYLVSLGAVTESEREDINGHASPWMNLLIHWGYDVYSNDVLALENRVQQIAENHSAQRVPNSEGVALGKFELTPPGYTIAARIASRLAGMPMQSDINMTLSATDR